MPVRLEDRPRRDRRERLRQLREPGIETAMDQTRVATMREQKDGASSVESGLSRAVELCPRELASEPALEQAVASWRPTVCAVEQLAHESRAPRASELARRAFDPAEESDGSRMTAFLPEHASDRVAVLVTAASIERSVAPAGVSEAVHVRAQGKAPAIVAELDGALDLLGDVPQDCRILARGRVLECLPRLIFLTELSQLHCQPEAERAG